MPKRSRRSRGFAHDNKILEVDVASPKGRVEEQDHTNEGSGHTQGDTTTVSRQNYLVSINSGTQNSFNSQCNPQCAGIQSDELEGSTFSDNQTKGTDANGCPQFSEAITEIEDLRNQLRQNAASFCRYDTVIKELHEQIADLKSAQHQRDRYSSVPFEAFIAQKDKYIRSIKDQLQDRQNLATFARLPLASCVRLAKECTTDGFRNLYFESQQVLLEYSRKKRFFAPDLDHHHDLQLLVHSLGLRQELPNQSTGNTVSTILKLGPQAFIRALTNTALREWVFATDFPRFDTDSSKLLAKYREHLAIQGM